MQTLSLDDAELYGELDGVRYLVVRVIARQGADGAIDLLGDLTTDYRKQVALRCAFCVLGAVVLVVVRQRGPGHRKIVASPRPGGGEAGRMPGVTSPSSRSRRAPSRAS